MQSEYTDLYWWDYKATWKISTIIPKYSRIKNDGRVTQFYY